MTNSNSTMNAQIANAAQALAQAAALARDGAEVLDRVSAFIRRYLVCDDHQLTLLTLWIANTWCVSCSYAVPYLDVRSPEPQCGKSICLGLLEQLCLQPAFVSAAGAGTLLHRLLDKRSFLEMHKNMEAKDAKDPKNAKDPNDRPRFPLTFLIDDCHQTFGPSDRHPLVALLNCGSDVNARYSYGREDYFVVGPKAFAGNAPLPPSLASRCIPIVLRRLKSTDQVQPFFADHLLVPAADLSGHLHEWAAAIAPRLRQVMAKPVQFPHGLTPRQRQCAEPLLRIANVLGAAWLAKTRAAIMAAFGVSEYSEQVQVLRDIRDLFMLNNQPEKLPTRDVLAYLRGLEDRPSNRWGSNHLSTLLRPFGIFSCNITVEGTCLKGYRLQDFHDAWDRYAGPLAAPGGSENSSARA